MSETPDVTVVTHTSESDSEPAVIAPVIIGDPGTDAQMVAVTAQLAELTAQNTILIEKVNQLESATETAIEVAVEAETAAITATETAEIAAELAVMEPDTEPVIEAEPEPDEPPSKQHWMFRERHEW